MVLLSSPTPSIHTPNTCLFFQHIAISAVVCNGRKIIRSYSPITSPSDALKGYIDLIIRLVSN